MAYLGTNTISKVSQTTDLEFLNLNTNDYVISQIQDNLENVLTQVSSKIESSSTYRSIAYVKSDKSISAGGNLTFDGVLYDPYGCWDVNTGIFTAPCDAVLEVTASLILTAGSSTDVTLAYGGQTYASIYSGTPSSTIVNYSVNFPMTSGSKLKLTTSAACTLLSTGVCSQVSMRW